MSDYDKDFEDLMTWDKRCLALRLIEVCDYVKSLEEENEKLQADNARLKSANTQLEGWLRLLEIREVVKESTT